jgi:hypothetical protein
MLKRKIEILKLLIWDSYMLILTLFPLFVQVRDVRLIMDRNSRRSKGVG